MINLGNYFTFVDNLNASLKIKINEILLDRTEDFNTISCINSEVDFETYKRIEQEGWFNFKPEIKNTDLNFAFEDFAEITIKIAIDPNLQPEIINQFANASQAVDYLQELNKTKPQHPAFHSDNWFIMEVKQKQSSGEIGYRTFWSYVSPSLLKQENISDNQIQEALGNLLIDWSGSKIPETFDDNPTETAEQFFKSLQELAEVTFKSIATNATAELIEVLEATSQELSQKTQENLEKKSISLYETVLEFFVDFFEEDDWSNIPVEDQSLLRMIFQGENGEWVCLAKVKEEENQFIFYSLYPQAVPQDKRLAIAEFITRANYGTIIGNFELDFDDGEIRYKTSIDVEGDNLSFALIKQMVYANVMMMDEYLPGIMAVIEQEVEVKEAILLVES